MKDMGDTKTSDLLRSPGAARQAAYAERQRERGRKKYSHWLTPAEAAKVSEYIENNLRKAIE